MDVTVGQTTAAPGWALDEGAGGAAASPVPSVIDTGSEAGGALPVRAPIRLPIRADAVARVVKP